MRTFTLDQANKLIPRVEKGLDASKGILQELRDVRDQLTDLRIIWGDKLETEACPDRKEYESFRDRFAALELQLRASMEKLTELGCEIKDPDVGLVDFYADRAGTIVYLCWRRGEKDIQFWHTLEAGFAGRQSIKQF